MEIFISYGIPGSGKTNNMNNKFIEKTIEGEECVFVECSDFMQYTFKDVLFFDGLFVTNKQLIDLIKQINILKTDLNIKIICFNPDVNISKYNDAFRVKKGLRKQLSDETIDLLNRNFEKVNLDNLQKLFPKINIEIIEYKTHKVPNWKEKLSIESLLKINGDYYTDEVINISSQKMYDDEWNTYFVSCEQHNKLNYEKLINILNEIFENLTLNEYKKFVLPNIKIIESEYDDYYDFGTRKQMFVNLEKVVNLISNSL